MRWFIAAFLLACAMVVAGCPCCHAGWDSGECVAVATEEPALVWKDGPSDRTQIHLFRGSVQIGTYRYDLRAYFPFDAATSTWSSEPGLPPSPCPVFPKRGASCSCSNCGKCGDQCVCTNGSSCTLDCKCILTQHPPKNFGVDKNKLSDTSGCHLNGKPVLLTDAFKALEVPDDSGLLRVTIIGTVEDTARVLQDLDANPILSAMKGKLVVQEYRPDEWEVKGILPAGASPTIYIQTPTGQVKHRQADYKDGAAGLYKAIRKVDPTIDPTSAPDLRNDPPPVPAPVPPSFSFDLEKIQMPVCCVLSLGMVALVLFLKRKE